jgi:aspartate/tyrosine/aromatic aminotransferase
MMHHDAANHHAIFNNVGIKPLLYPYYDPRTIGLDFDGFVAALQSSAERSVFLLHACAHNPTGVDPTVEQWNIIADAMLKKKHYAFFDAAYQGFASGDLDRDAAAVRIFVLRGVPMLVAQVRNSTISVARSLCGLIAELRQKCGAVWRTRWCTPCCITERRECEPRAQSIVCVAEERDIQPTIVWCTCG